MKKLCLLLALMLVLLCGCNGESTQTIGNSEKTNSSESSVSSTEGSETTATQTTGTGTTEELVIPKVEDIAYQVPEYDGEQKVPYDPNWQVYFSTYNMDMDFYPNGDFFGFSATVITKEYYTLEEIRLNIPAQTPYEISVHDVTAPPDLSKLPEGTGWDGPGKYMDYHYLCQQGIDWQEYGQAAANMYAESAILLEYGHIIREKGKYGEYDVYGNAYRKMRDEYKAQYEALEVKAPPFNAYSIGIRFTDVGAYEETIETFEYVLGDESYTVDIGQIRLHTECPEELTVGRSINRIVRGMSSFGGTQYNGGYYKLVDGEAFSFYADKDLIVTGFRQLGTEVGIVGASVEITGEEDVDFYWDVQKPLVIDKGDHVSISLYLKDERFTQYEMNITTYFILDYEINGKAYTMCMPCNFKRSNYHCWDVYLMLAIGYDIGEYYTCYYVPYNESWIQDLPEQWRK